jgi:hypothetical protein
MLRYLVITVTMLTVMVSNAYAIPAFARQMGVSCSACHSANGYDTLNRFGRDFKASGYTMVGSEKTIGDGKFMSLPSTLNMSVVAGTTIDSGTGSTGTSVATNNFGVFLGGRINNNVGVFVEVGYDEGSSTQADHFSLANLAVPITYKMGDNTYGVVPYSTDGHTATASEFYDNGGTGAISHVGARDAYGAKGLSFYVYNQNYFVNYVPWSNGNKSGSEVKLANYLRVAYTPQIGNWDLEIGAQYMTGNTNDTDGNGFIISNTTKKTDAYVIDAQALGTLGKFPVDLGMSYARAKYDANSLFTTNTDGKDGTSLVLDAKLGVIPKVLIAMINFSHDDHAQDSNDKVNTTHLACRYFITENVKFEPYYDIISGHAASADNVDTYGLAFEVAF